MQTPFNKNFCTYCGQDHNGLKCPQVKTLEYNEDGTVKRVTFFSPSELFVPIPSLQTWPWPQSPPQPISPYFQPAFSISTVNGAANDN
jgi:hypothetical protein